MNYSLKMFGTLCIKLRALTKPNIDMFKYFKYSYVKKHNNNLILKNYQKAKFALLAQNL